MTNQDYERIANKPLTDADRFTIYVSRMRRTDLIAALAPIVGRECKAWGTDELRNTYSAHFAPGGK